MKRILFYMVFVVASTAVWVSAQESRLSPKLFFPGMQQISAGEGNALNKSTLKGLGFMTGFALCLHSTVSSISEMESYAEETQRKDAAYKSATGQEQRDIAQKAQKAAWENYDNAQIKTAVFVSLTTLFYAGSIVDALFFSESKKDQSRAILPENVRVSMGATTQSANLKIQCRF